MTNAFSLFRSLVTYSICLPLAIVLGYMLATPMDQDSMVMVGLTLGLLTIPLFLRWHYPWLLACWNANALLFFLPGKPQFAWMLILISFTISFLQYVLNKEHKFISVPSVTKPLLFIVAVVLVTARLTGGIGLNSMGSDETVGGKRYVTLFMGVLGYFALTAVKIPPQKRKLFIGLFYGGGLSMGIANLASILTPGLYFIFLVFPADIVSLINASQSNVMAQSTINRLGGMAFASVTVLFMMLARTGIRGLFDPKKYWRLPLAIFCFVASLYGGYRSGMITLLLTFAFLFYMEGLMRSRLLPLLLLFGILGIAVALPQVDKLPFSVQRSLAFLPIDIDPMVRQNAEGSSEWRFQMWNTVLPTIPQYLILGKGLGISAHEFDMSKAIANKGDNGISGALLAGDYHNGPLSLIIPFGLFGTFGFIWFLVAGFKVLRHNYVFGDPDLVIINRFIFVQFVVKIIGFFLIFGSFYADLLGFAGLLGLSIALNGGVAKPALAPVTRPVFNKFRLANAARSSA